MYYVNIPRIVYFYFAFLYSCNLVLNVGFFLALFDKRSCVQTSPYVLAQKETDYT